MLSLNRILVPRDFSAVSDRALSHGLTLASHTGATLHVLHAEVPYAAENREAYDSDPTADLDTFRNQLQEVSWLSPQALDEVSVVGATRRDVAAAPAILQYATDEDVDVIVLGTHGRRGASRMLLGSVAEEVVRRADRPVVTVRGEEEDPSSVAGPIERILVPLDFSKHSREALRTAMEWAALYEAHLDLLHVVEETLHPAFYVGGVQSIYDAQPNIEEKVRANIEGLVEDVGRADVNTSVHVGPGRASSEIPAFVDDQDSDLVVMSTHGRTGMERFFLGSVAEKVVRHVACPVLTVKAFGTSLVPSASAEATTAS